MLLTNILLAAIWLHSLLVAGDKESLADFRNEANKSLLTAGVYAKLLTERRAEHQIIIKKMLSSNNYEKNFKLLRLAYGKIFEIINDKNITLTSRKYNPLRDGFPENAELQDAVTLITENCCMAAESLLHFPEISYRIFGKQDTKWNEILTWCNEFVNSLPHIIDESTVKLMSLLIQEINEEQRMPDYLNPYYKESRTQVNKKKRKNKKQNRGPSLSRAKTEL
ncbi:coiled-coil domain-containing protein 134 [Ceratitis capitata]|uniref:Coiled-coil domain-containing protein 134 n=2 Tax=Ceratitis capitata TaxID=7213 RepID=W8BK20_CERCA|nr:coiled-coil domain-containing protein 134 [Ceratitis capitata]